MPLTNGAGESSAWGGGGGAFSFSSMLSSVAIEAGTSVPHSKGRIGWDMAAVVYVSDDDAC